MSSHLPEDTTGIVWFKYENNVVQQDLIHTVYVEKPFATTEVRFTNLRRNDTGLYLVVIRNSFEGLPLELRHVDTSFELKVKS